MHLPCSCVPAMLDTKIQQRCTWYMPCLLPCMGPQRHCSFNGVGLLRTPLMSYHAHNERARESSVLTRLQQGEAVAVVSDAGMPVRRQRLPLS